jgi:hypothetical protein
MRKRRGPFTDPREGRLLREVDCAFTTHKADVLTTTVLLDWCYGARVIRKLHFHIMGLPEPLGDRPKAGEALSRASRPLI